MRFRKDPFFERNLQKSDDLKGVRRGAAKRIADASRTLADVRSGRFRNSFYVAEEGETIASASSDPGSVAIEFGSRNNPPHGTQRRAVGAAGYRFKDEGAQ